MGPTRRSYVSSRAGSGERIPYGLILNANEKAVLGEWRYPLGWGPFTLNILRQVVYIMLGVIGIIFWTTEAQLGWLMIILFSLIFGVWCLVQVYGFYGVRDIWRQKHNLEDNYLRTVLCVVLLIGLGLIGFLGLGAVYFINCKDIYFCLDSSLFLETDFIIESSLVDMGVRNNIGHVFIFVWGFVLVYSSGYWVQSLPISGQVGQLFCWFIGFLLKHIGIWLWILYILKVSQILIQFSEFQTFFVISDTITFWQIPVACACGFFLLDSYLTIMPTSLFKSLTPILYYYRKIADGLFWVMSREGYWFSRIIWLFMLLGIFIYYILLLVFFIYPLVVTPTAGLFTSIINEDYFGLNFTLPWRLRTLIFTFWGYYTILSLPGLIFFLRPVYTTVPRITKLQTRFEDEWKIVSLYKFENNANSIIIISQQNLKFLTSTEYTEWRESALDAGILTDELKAEVLEHALYIYIYEAPQNYRKYFMRWGLLDVEGPILFFVFDSKKLPKSIRKYLIRG